MRLDGRLGRATFPDMNGDLGVDATTLMIALPGNQQHQDEALEPSRHSRAPRESLARTDVGSQVGRKLESA
jgi:hypothetical protein